jgi:hypothetical protein
MMREAALALVLAAAPGIPGTAAAAESAGGGALGEVFGGAMPLSPADLAGLTSGGPLVLSDFESAGGGSAVGTVETCLREAEAASLRRRQVGPDGGVAIRTQSQASATLTGAAVTQSGGQLTTGSFAAVTMENGAGIAGLQMASGLNNIQQSATSFVFVLSGLPQF